MKSKILGILFAVLVPAVLAEKAAALSQDAERDDQSVSTARRSWLGVSLQDLTAKLAKALGVGAEEGALVSDVMKNSPAESAGIKEGDVIVEFNGKRVYDADDLVRAVSKLEPGTKVDVIVMRKNEKKTFQVTLGRLPRKRETQAFTFPMPRVPEVFAFGYGNILGMKLMELNEQLGAYFEAPDNRGVLVEEVKKSSAADKAGFKAGDVITRAAGKRVDELRKITRALEDYEEGDKVDFEIVRKGTRKTLTVEIDKEIRERGFHFYFDRGTRPPMYFKHDPDFFFDEGQHSFKDLQLDLKRLTKELKEKALKMCRDLKRELSRVKMQWQEL